jgi:hypothetical protein
MSINSIKQNSSDNLNVLLSGKALKLSTTCLDIQNSSNIFTETKTQDTISIGLSPNSYDFSILHVGSDFGKNVILNMDEALIHVNTVLSSIKNNQSEVFKSIKYISTNSILNIDL